MNTAHPKDGWIEDLKVAAKGSAEGTKPLLPGSGGPQLSSSQGGRGKMTFKSPWNREEKE